jgi:histidine triad (HIT) family protein
MENVPCIFCEIASGNAPAAIVHRDERFCAFLDARPVFKGHVLVIPVTHFADFSALPQPLVGPLFERVQQVSTAVQKGLECDGAFIATNEKVSQSVPHLHVHVVPRRKKDGLRGFFWPRTKYESDAEASAYAQKIAQWIGSRATT